MSTVTQDQTQPNADSRSGGQTKETIEATTAAVKNRWLGLADETRRTVLYAAAAILCLLITGMIELATRPAVIAEYGKVGKEFFPEFRDPTLASALNVAVIDPDQVEAKQFSVQRTANGQWVIPSHHNYPADAEDQLARTASSVIGIKRGAMVTRWQADHARYGVVDPKTDTLEVGQVEGVGKRLTLRGEDDSVLADYIIGKQVEDEFDQYYVRHPDEDEVYVATLNIDLSTRFSDWINTDLFDINQTDVVNVSLNDYQFDELKGTVTQREVTTLRRETSLDDWKMDGIDDATEQVKKDAIADTVNAIANLDIVGVRPKQTGLTPDLRLDRDALGSQRDVDRLQSDLLSRGFLLQPDQDNSDTLKLISREGELASATNDGLVYNLYFGRVFTGSQEELELGFANNPDQASEDAGDSDSTDDKNESSDENESSDSGKPGRYVFVTVNFDRQFLGEAPEKPTKPERPEELSAADAETGEATSSESETSEGSEASDDGEASDEQAEADRLKELREAYDAEMEAHNADLETWQSYQDKIDQGKEKAESLNRRFAQWYYVIAGEDYDKLALSRGDLVEAKEEVKEPESDSPSESETEAGLETATEPQSPTEETAAANQAAADEFLAENQSKDGVVTTESGLQYEVLTEGEGESPSGDSRVKVRYKGTLIDGTVFDQSGDTAVEFGVDQVIPGWTEALQQMKPGAKWKLYIPPKLAYGERGSGDKIGPNTLLIFEVELVSVDSDLG
ncbi:putative FKBP-type peptidyl-prolyl cis-trans isomerase FkpA precursor [Stieleria neptunia]|uniref:peptidylprolyl isomerase n=1 Tax=Stieleria neptunia TaxID=2527979 RepID=A0A518HSB0_9BACT|nr:FKBP-type peptidyl-prolyl cis-trans isomerase [Stieleria neptunia]QDV43732.1 putative FKBP-type peptidyl-prolyl cis-trans isomerase FkpA precursor [Stieleria neptunia]